MRNLSTTMRKNKNDLFPNGLQFREIPERDSVAIEIWETDNQGELWDLVSSFHWYPKNEGLIHAVIDCLRNEPMNERERVALEWFKEYQENN
jgi:hypothetical protein